MVGVWEGPVVAVLGVCGRVGACVRACVLACMGGWVGGQVVGKHADLFNRQEAMIEVLWPGLELWV